MNKLLPDGLSRSDLFGWFGVLWDRMLDISLGVETREVRLKWGRECGRTAGMVSSDRDVSKKKEVQR